MSLSEEVHQAAQNVVAASETTLHDELNRFIGRFVGVPFNAAPGAVRDGDGNQTGRFASIIHTGASGTGDAGVFSADAVAAVVDATEELTLESFRAAYGRVAQAKQLKKTPPTRVPGVPRTTVTLGIIMAARSSLSLEAIAEELERLNASVAGEHRTDMVVVGTTGAINYAVQFPGESVTGDFLPPGDGALDAYTPPMYVVMVMRPTGAHTLNKMIAIRLKAEIMVDHFHEQVLAAGKIGGQARAMVVCSGIERALQSPGSRTKYFHAFKTYLVERKSPYQAIVAFSGEHEHGGAKVSETSLEDLEDAPQHARADPLLKPAVARLIRRIPVWQVGPRSAGPQDPQNAIEHGTVLPPRAPSTVLSARQLGQEGRNEVPLLVGEVTGMRRIQKGHPARMAPRHTATDADEPSVAATAYTRLFQQTLEKTAQGTEDRGEGVSPDEAVPIVKQIAEALEAAHQHSDASLQYVDPDWIIFWRRSPRPSPRCRRRPLSR